MKARALPSSEFSADYEALDRSFHELLEKARSTEYAHAQRHARAPAQSFAEEQTEDQLRQAIGHLTAAIVTLGGQP